MADQSEKQTAVAARPTPTEAKAKPTHEVAEGETLDAIAKQHKTTVAQLQKRNAIHDPDLIWPGMTLDLS